MAKERPAKAPLYPRTWVRRVACPACGAKPGERCQGVSGPRESNHLERVWAYHEGALD